MKKQGIEYKDRDQQSTVYIDGKIVGHIMRDIGGKWFYSPAAQGSARGEKMDSRQSVKRSLESA